MEDHHDVVQLSRKLSRNYIAHIEPQIFCVSDILSAPNFIEV